MQHLHLNYWHWWAIGCVLLVLEILIPSAFFIWIGIAALAIGFVVMFLPGLDFEPQLFLYAITALTFLILGRIYFTRNPIRSEQPLLNERTLQYQGRTFTIVEPIINGLGKVQIDGSLWRVEGPDCVVGTRVRVIEASGMHLGVEIVTADESSDEPS